MSADDSSWREFKPTTLSKTSFNQRIKHIEQASLRHAHRFVTSRLDRLSGVKRQVSGWVVLVMLLVGLSAAQWVIGRQAYTTTTGSPGGTYSEGVLGPVESLNPLYARSSAELSAARLLFASLYKYDTTGSLKGDLAESIAVDDHEKTYTVTLRPRLRWSDGVNLTADDVVFTVNLLANPETNATLSGWRSIKAIKVDDRTVRFTLPSSYAPFRHALTFPVLPEHVLKDVKPSELAEHSFSQAPTASGPFIFRLTQNLASDGSRKVVHLVANPYYHGDRTKLERFQLYVYSSRDDITKALRTKEILATPSLNYDSQADDIKSMYQSDSYVLNNGVYALFNTQSELLQSSEVRRALSLSVNTTALRQQLAISTSELNGPIISDLVSTPAHAHNVEQARQLLDEAGWKVQDGVRQKDGVKLAPSIVSLKGNSAFEEVSNKLAEIWRNELSIEAEVRSIDPNSGIQDVLQSVLQPRNFDILVYELVLGGDPDVFAYWHSSQASISGLNFSNYNSALADDALSSGRARISPKLRADRYDRFVKKWREDVPAIALYRSNMNYIHLGSVGALGRGTELVSAEDRFSNVNRWTIHETSVYKTP